MTLIVAVAPVIIGIPAVVIGAILIPVTILIAVMVLLGSYCYEPCVIPAATVSLVILAEPCIYQMKLKASSLRPLTLRFPES